MNKPKKLLYFSLVLFLAIIFLPIKIQAATFNPNLIISDEEMLDSSSMTRAEIDLFLKSKNGYISKHTFKNHDGITMAMSQIIYEASNNYDCDGIELSENPTRAERALKCPPTTINPKLLLVLLQKEQSLIEETDPTQRQLDWATGYGCPDGGGCNSYWEGIGKQINSAALQFFDYMENPHHYSYRAGQTYTISNTGRPAMLVTPINKATAALYNYTPHVYNGNYNFHNLWLRYFTHHYPSNTLLQARGEPGVWLIKNNQKRPFLTKGALTTRYDLNKVVHVNKSELDRYPTGAAIKFPQYSLVRSPRGTIFLLVDDKRRGFASSEAFRKIGFNPEEVINASWEDINTYEEGIPITSTSSYPTGALLQDNKTGGIYYVSEGTKAPLWDSVLLKTKFRRNSITPVSPEKLSSYKTIEPTIFNDGELLKTQGKPAVYVIDNKQKRPVVSGKIFEQLGYRWENIIEVPEKISDLYEDGEPIADIYVEDEEEVLSEETAGGNASSSPDSLATSTPETASSTNDNDLQEEINDILNPGS